MPGNYPIIGWRSGSLALGLGGGKCRLARARIERPAFGPEIEEVVLRSQLWRIPKRPLPPASPQTLLSSRRRLPMNSRGVSSRQLSLLIPDDAGRYRETVEAGAWILTDGI